ncbi:MAG TPA: ATP-binding protein [Acidimicrobiales bacterium]|nr:ATP-binding protein [Acidimicrobiales bacterium]
MSIRLRLAVVFAIAAATVFALGSALFVSTLSSGLLGTIDSQLGTELAQAGTFAPSPAGPGDGGTAVARPLPGEFIVQLVDSAGAVRNASHDAGTAPLLPKSLLDRARTQRIALTVTIDGDPSRVVAAPFAGRVGWIAVASVTLDGYAKTLGDVYRELWAAGAVFVAVAAAGAYVLARAALSPVERLRREAADLSARDDHVVLEVPATRDEIAALATTMNELLARLHAALARQRTFVADASHELRTPFAVLRAELELAGRPGRSRGELERAVASAAEETARLNRLTDDLLALARSDDGELTVRRSATDIGGILRRSAQVAALPAAACGVELRVDAPDGLVASVDADRVRQAVDNLVDNAVRHAPRGTAVVLHARSAPAGDGVAGDGVVVEVADAGPGFPPEFLPHAFERFRRPDTSRARSGGGAGLGLAIVQAIAAAHGGDASARNAPAGGAVVSLVLPAAGRAPAARAARSAPTGP